MKEVLRRKALSFLEDGYTCALVREDKILSSKERGVKPLLEWLAAKMDCTNTVAADKVVGKAAAYLYVLLNVREVHANVISVAAEEVFQRFQIPYFYGERVAAIRNRANTGFCPMEQAVWNVDAPQEAYALLCEKIAEERKK